MDNKRTCEMLNDLRRDVKLEKTKNCWKDSKFVIERTNYTDVSIDQNRDANDLRGN